MSSKLFVLCLAVAAFAAMGCSGVFVQKEVYDKDTRQLKEYISGLERDNAAYRGKAGAYDQLKQENDLAVLSSQSYGELVETLKKALDGLSVDARDAFVDPKTGAFVLADDLVFDLGKFTISAKGREILKRFAEKNRGSQIRVVGHTDATKVVKVSTRESLPITHSMNLELSSMRAVAVAFELTKSGIPERQILIEGRGSSQPRGGNSRRVELFVLGGNGKTSLK